MKTRMFFLFASMFIYAATLSSCGGEAHHEHDHEDDDHDATEEAGEGNAASAYTITPFAASAEFADAALESMDYKGGKFTYKVGGESYSLGAQTPDAPQKMCANSGKGQHIHPIIDDNPYIARYTSGFEEEVAAGEHYILSFLSRSYHESIKTPQAHIAKKVTVEGGAFASAEDITAPMLFYSRPKGTYVGKAETGKVMLDFYLTNVELSAGGYKVKVNINGEQELTLDKWQPYYIEGLPMGDNKIQLTLVDKDGNTVDTPLNPVERVFTLKEDPAEGQ
jgi:hypothetical protein